MTTLHAHFPLVRSFSWAIGFGTLLLVACGGTDGAETSPTAATASPDTPTPTITATPSPAASPESSGMRLQLPSIGLDAAVEEIGVTPDGSLAMPAKPANVGWYNSKLSSSMYLGDAPGAGGNSVWAGYQGTAFNKLPQVTLGADVFVVSNSGRVRYQVLSKTSYEPAKMLASMGQIIDPKARPPSKEWMTMITADKVNDKNEVVSFLVVVAQRADQ